MSALLGAGFAGILAFLFSIPSFLKSKADDKSLFWMPSGPNASAKLAKRARLVLSKWSFLFAWPLYLPSIGALLILTVLTWGSGGGMSLGGWRLDLLLGFLAGSGIGFGVAYFMGLRKSIASNLEAVAIQACKSIARKGSLSDAEAILGRAAQMPQKRNRLAAAIALRYLGTTEGNAILESLLRDPDPEVASKAANALENINATLNGEGRLSVMPLDGLRQEYQQVNGLIEVTVDNASRARMLAEQDRLRKAFDEVVYSQLPLRRSYPYLFCMDCLCRSEEVVFTDWAWVRCARCKDVFGLKHGVVTVTGQVGGVRGWELRNGELKLSLWEAEERKARGAEIDVLEIVGGQEISYDWAVSAVIEQLRAFTQDGNPKAHVKYVNEPQLSLNTLKLLRIVDKVVAVGE